MQSFLGQSHNILFKDIRLADNLYDSKFNFFLLAALEYQILLLIFLLKL